MEIEIVKQQTTWNDAARSINSNNSKINIEIEKLKSATYKSKGYFKTLASLQSAYPTASLGCKAYVGSNYPYDIYLWEDGAWVNTNEKGGDETIDFKDCSDEIEALQTELESQNELILDLQNIKIDKENDDYYPNMSVGTADNLSATDIVDSEFSFRRSGGGAISDGVARIQTIKGNSLVWNQLINNVADTTGNNGWWVRQGSSLAIEGREIVVTTNTSGSFNQISQKIDFIEGHNYLITFGMSASINTESNLQIALSSTLYGAEQESVAYVLEENMAFIKIHAAKKSFPYLILYQNSLVAEGTQMRYTDFKVIDLTLMFGVGNEPTTIEEAYARMPIGVDLNAHEEGKVIDLTADSLVSIGFNQWDEEWENGYYDENGQELPSPNMIRSKNYIPVLPSTDYYYGCSNSAYKESITIIYYDKDKRFISSATKLNLVYKTPSNAAYMKIRLAFGYGNTYNHDICINLSDSSKNGTYEPYIKRTQTLDIIGKYFPEGMRSAIDAHDEIRYNKATQKWEKVQRVGSVDMGSLNWSYEGVSESYPHGFFYTNMSTDLRDKSIGSKVLCPLYASGGFKDDKSIASNVSNNMVYVRDSSYTDAESFKAAMVGIILYYELAKPIVTILDDDFNLDYEVWNGGTEEVISDVPTTPLKADIAYGFNAVGLIKQLRAEIASVQAILANLQIVNNG